MILKDNLNDECNKYNNGNGMILIDSYLDSKILIDSYLESMILIDSYLEGMILIDNLNNKNNNDNNGNSDHPDYDTALRRISMDRMIDRWKIRLIVTLTI